MLTPKTVTVLFPDAAGGQLYGQLARGLHRTSAPTGLTTKIHATTLDETGAGSLDVWATDDVGSYPAGLVWHFWVVVAGRGRWDTLVQLPTDSPEPVALEDLPPAIPIPTTAGWISYIPLDQKAVANGVATLDSAGLVPADQLPPPGSTPTDLLAWAAAEAWAWADVTYDNTYPLQIASATLTWPDGSPGIFTSLTIDAVWQEITDWTATHAASGQTITYGTLTRNAQGQIIDPPATYSVA